MPMDGRIGGRLDIPWYGHGLHVCERILSDSDYVGKWQFFNRCCCVVDVFASLGKAINSYI